MSNSGKQAHDFYRDVIKHRKVWTMRNPSGYPRFVSPHDGSMTQPFWSTITRVQKVIKTIPDYKDYEIVEVAWNTFIEEWAPKCKKQNIFIGVNWAGKNLSGFDMSAEQLVEHVNINTLTPHSSGTPNGAP